MTVYNPLPELFPEDKTAVALGMFDGLHKGHLAVLNALIKNADGLSTCVFTFSTSLEKPDAKTNARLLSDSARDALIKDMGIRYILEPEFSLFRGIEAKDFAKDFLGGYLNARLVFCGESFRFGKNASASAHDLNSLLPNGSKAVIIPELELLGEAVSSTRIRRLVREGDMELAAELLGRDFFIDFVVEHGRKLGRTLDFPTINQAFPDGFAVPRFGVYASVTEISGKRYVSVTNVGVKPTVGSSRILAETYIEGFSGDLYGQKISVSLRKFMRPEVKFDSVDALRAQIMQDVKAAHAFSF